MADNELPGKVKAWVDARIGGNAITRKPGHPHAKDDKCFVLVDDALQGAGAKTARDFAPDGRIGPNDNYVWGDPVELDKIQPGDVLQFRNHKVVVRADVQNENGMWREQSTSGPYVRPHHCAIVVEVKADGTVVVAEQNVKPHADKVSRNEIARLEAGEETRRVSREQRLVIKVEGQVWAFRPVAKPKGAMWVPPAKGLKSGSRNVYARYVARDGGLKLPPGPLGRA
jgi:hypothetical protein